MKILPTIKVGGVNEHFNLPWIKLSENTHEENNFKLEWKSYAGGTGVLTSALRSGEIDMAVLLTEGLLLDILQNDELRMVCFHVSNPLRWAIHIRKSDLQNSFNFENKRFAISRKGSGSHTMAKFLLNENKLSYREKMMIEVGSLEGGLNSVEKNESDIFLWEKYTTEPFLDQHHLIAHGEVLTPWPPFSVAVTKKFLESDSSLIKSIVSAVRKNATEILLDPNTTDYMKSRWKIEPENATRWLSEIKWDNQIPLESESLAPVLENMKKAGLIESIPSDLKRFLN